jgi:hypothetical protein
MNRLSIAVFCFLISLATDSPAWISEGQGSPLQLMSFELTGAPPVIDGSLMSRDGDPSSSDAMDEWKGACSRTLFLNDGGIVQIFLVNSPETLYLGMTYEHGNNGDGSGITLYFDEGDSTATFDGAADFTLTNTAGRANEQSCNIRKSGSSEVIQDRCWNGAAWVNDGDGQVDFQVARYYFSSGTKVHHYELAIPLNNAKNDAAQNSDLDVAGGQEIGFFFTVRKEGAGAGTFYWAETGGDSLVPSRAPTWGEIKLSVPRDYFTFYTSPALKGPPVIDGAIQESAWTASLRQIILSNYHYTSLACDIWCLEEPNSGYIYLGLRVYDLTHNTGDYCQVYLEEKGENTTDSVRDYDLDNGAEQALRASAGAAAVDLAWNVGSGAWTTDTEVADSQKTAGGNSTYYTDYEFRLLRQGGAQDVDIPSRGLLGFLIRYHDADQVGDSTDYYWEYTTNNQGQLLDQNANPDVWLATGWANLQLGVPAFTVTAPLNSQLVSGLVAVRAVVGGDPVFSAFTDTLAQENVLYFASVSATDADFDAVYFFLISAPSGLALDSSSGQLRWMPPGAQAGVHAVQVGASDGKGGYDTLSFNLTVNGVNDPPQIMGSSRDTTILEFDSLLLRLVTLDADYDTLSYFWILGPDTLQQGRDSTFLLRTDGASAGTDSITVVVSDGRGGTASHLFVIRIQDRPLAVQAEQKLPAVFSLGPNTPNPGHPSTLITFGVPQVRTGAHASRLVSLVVYDIQGRMVRTLVDGPAGPGYHSVSFNGTDDRGQNLVSGIYLYRLRGEGFSQIRRLLLLK